MKAWRKFALSKCFLVANVVRFLVVVVVVVVVVVILVMINLSYR